MPRDEGIEAIVELESRVDGVEADAVPELAQAPEGMLALGRGEVVEDALRHHEVGRLRAGFGLEPGQRERRVEREVDVVPQQQITGRRLVVEKREPVAARLGRCEQLAVMREVERAAHVPPAVGTGTRACP